jgi:hypothetical protein
MDQTEGEITMCSNCQDGWNQEYESDDTDQLITEGAAATRNLSFLLANPEELLPFSEDDSDIEEKIA